MCFRALYRSTLAMREAKRQGRNTWHCYEESNKISPNLDYAHLRLELMEAVKRSSLHYSINR